MATASTLPTSGNQFTKDLFNREAAAWESNPLVHALSDRAWIAIREFVPGFNSAPDAGTSANSGPDILEIGCGTGLLTVQTATQANRVVAIDAATAMIEVLETKLKKPNAPNNVLPLAIMLEDPEDASLPPADPSQPSGPRLKYDLITSHLVLHHLPEVPPILRTMFGCLKPGGRVALTDFEDFGPEAKRFHQESRLPSVERHGIKRNWIAGEMEKVGFVNVQIEVAWRHVKDVEKYPGQFDAEKNPVGEEMEFSYLICLGRRPES